MRTPACILAALLLATCSRSTSTSSDDESSAATTPGPASSPSSSAAAEATKIYQARCVACHGADGKGDGPTAKSLTPRPQNFQDPAWQSARQDGDIERAIQLGGSAVGKSPLMPPNPDLASKPEVIKALRAHIRALVAH